MSVSSDSCHTGENSDSADALNSNRPQRLSFIRKRRSLTSPSPRSHAPAPLSHLTPVTTGASPPPSNKDRDRRSDYTKPSSVARKRSNTAAPSGRGETLGRAHARHPPSADTAAAPASSLQASRATDVDPYARTNPTTLNAASFSLTRMRPSSAASPATVARSTTQHAPHRSTSRSGSRTVPGFLHSTFSSRAHLPAPPPELPIADAALAPLQVSMSGTTSSNHNIDAESAPPPTKSLLPSSIERGQKMCGTDNNGVIRPGRTQASDLGPPTGTPVALAVIHGSRGRGYGGTSGVRAGAAISPPFLLDGDVAPIVMHPNPLTDPAPHIYGGKRRNRVTLESSFASASEGADGEPVQAPPPPASVHSSSQSVKEQLGITADVPEELRSSSTMNHASSQPDCTPPQHLQKQPMHVHNPSQSMVALSSVPQTPRRPAIVPEVRDRHLPAPKTPQLNEKSQIARSGEEAVCTVLRSSLPAASYGAPIYKARPVPPFSHPPPECAPVNADPAQRILHPCTSSAGKDGPPSSTALDAEAGGSTEPQLRKGRQRRSASSCTPESSSSLERRSSASSRSPSVDAAVYSPACAHEQPLSKESIRSASLETTTSAHLSQRNPSAPRSPFTSAVTPPSSVDPAAELSPSRSSVHNEVEEETPVARRAPPQQEPMRLPELHVVAESAVSAASERSLSSHRSGSCSTPLESFAALLEDLHVLWREEEPLTCQVSNTSHASNGAFDGCASRSTASAMAEPKDDESSSLMYPADTSDHNPEGLEEVKQVPESSLDELLRGTDTTGHAPITPRLRHRIEKDQQRELEMLRAVTKERHPEIFGLLDSPQTLMRELERMGADRDGQEFNDRGTTSNATDEVTTPPAARSPRKRPPAVPASSQTSLTTLVAQGSRAKPEERLPVRDAGGAAAPTTEKSCTTESSARKGKPSVSATSTSSGRARERSQAVLRSSRRTNAPENGSAGNGDGVSISTPRGRAAGEAGSGARGTGMPPFGAMGGAAPPLSTTALNSQLTAAVPGTPSCIRDSRRRSTAPSMTPSGGSEPLSRTASRRGDGPSGLSSGAGTSSPQKAAATASEDLLPELFSAEEAANTITIVFDLDETLCNNRCFTGPILRPGAELLLHTLRGLCPSPQYKVIDTHTRSQHASSRLYDEAMHRMGVAPLYRSRVAQRQSADGYRRTNSTAPAGTVAASGASASEVSGPASSAGLCSTGEARPATAKDTNPLRLELVLWTASEESLARRAMRHIDPANKIFDEAIYRDARWYRDSHYTKELCRLGRCINRVVIVENSIESVIRNRQNSILVTSFVRNRLDRQLFLVREVLRDWVCGMRAKLAEQQYASRAASSLRESVERTTDHDAALRSFRGNSVGSRTGESVEEGGESPVPPHSTRPLARVGRSESMTVMIDHAGTRIDAGDPINDNSGGNDSQRGSTPELAPSAPCRPSAHVVSVPSSPLPPATRPLSAMARRAPNIVEFLQHHRLIFPDSNFLRFQLTGDVMKHLQTKEAALIAAALHPPLMAAEQPAARAARSIGYGPVSRTTRPTRAPLNALPSSTPPVTTTAATTASPGGPAPRTPQFRAAGRASPSRGGVAVDGVAAAVTRQRTPGKEAGAARTPVAVSTPTSPSGGSVVGATGNSRLGYSSSNDATRAANAHRDPVVRLQRTASAPLKRPVTNETYGSRGTVEERK
ncbi:conserved hypothetical protein [Leishmania mexicana MHOM/GT/2001/U1103]|uniref:FCP1 homology domain-containing protein n=1 Tax=Leishmania mexicana (strain MHOM/GT/2001/U1103) TaxID=929439 RepID=E9B3R1_LEIMU|nr:conserved hypothetical protein [Leishmania mexicana MHOM/GT/2001/U1103]CBZ29878.1 conserved hypothetical protein [Leishmania mexicana MHOM/GT/2001/U1103]